MLLFGPDGKFPSARQTIEKPPSNRSQISVAVMGPPGPIGPGLNSPTVDQSRARNKERGAA